MFAIIRTGGKQYRVAEQDLITVDKIAGEPGETVEFADVLMLGGEETVLGSPVVAGATVAGEVVKQGRGDKIIAFKKRRRKNSRRKRGHRQELSVIRITEILTDGRKPSPRPQAAEAAPAAEEAAGEPGATPEVEAGAVGEADASETAEAKPARKRAKKPAEEKTAD